MQQFELMGSLGAVTLGLLAATGLIYFWIKSNSNAKVTARILMQEAEDSIAFLFDNETLVDATPRARAVMDHGDGHRSDWENFLTLLAARFPHLRSQCRDLASVGKKSISPADGGTDWIEAEHWNGLARITVVQDRGSPVNSVDPLTAAAMEHELQTLRSIGENSPQLIWKRDAEGVLVWANRAYIELAEAINPVGPDDVLPWPPRDVFKDTAVPAGSAPIIDMSRIDMPGHDRPVWYEVTSIKRGTDTMYFAADSSASVFAKDAQQNFVQTLTKTFAQLSVGLAIFDSERRLVLFNPALTDLTGLSAEFLIGRPALFSVLDRLRDQHMIPEPKNYATWRDQMVALETAASEGNYHENWSLSGGQTFRVTGRPHPNGAIAFLMEDISDEVSLTRRFRSQIDASNAIIDNLNSAVCVFSASGSLIMANRAYRHLWGTQPEGSLNSREFADELESWEAVSAPSPVWLKLKETMSRGGGDAPWNGTVWLDSHVEMVCSYAPLPDGNHQVTFYPLELELTAASTIEPLEFKANRALPG